VSASRRLPAVAAVLAWSVLLAGCEPAKKQVHPAHQRLEAPPNTISVFQLAGRLKLEVASNSASFAHLMRPPNSVTIFPDPGGAIFVNGGRLLCQGQILVTDSTIFVPDSAEQVIREALRPDPPPPPPPPRPSEPEKPPPVVVLDPGHGGHDPGAIACNGVFEKDVVLPVALMVSRQLQQNNLRVVMTRSTDRFVELERRAEIANAAQADLFVSIHADWLPDPGLHGHTVYVAHGASPRTLAAAQRLDRHLATTGTSSRGVRAANYRVLVRTTCPAMLVELGCLSHRLEARRLSSEDHRRAAAEAIATAIVEHLHR